ncbi:sex-determining transformer protein 1-like [Haliotis rufescens]|uniref:sex-determining transformer protein 1-like n=1 Tax=Haliotis rufescens TaxID=6454 RepID=UPI00201F465A|nr:sex-determining transformer protein 1-like [Haliotis rufescens]
MDQTSDRIFKEGNLSPVVYSFAQMKGVTSTTLVDFSCRFTWSVTDFKENDQDQNMSISTHPEPRYISSQRHIPSRDSFSHLYNQPMCQACPYQAAPNAMSNPLSSTMSSPMSSPLSHPLSLPPPHMHLPNYGQHPGVYPRGHVTPKTFSPVLIYHRPSLTFGDRFKDAENKEAQTSYFEKDRFRLGLHGLEYKRMFQGDNVKGGECTKDGLGFNSAGYQNCLYPEFKRPGFVVPHQPTLQPSQWLPRAEKEVLKLPHGDHSTTSAFQAWRPQEQRRNPSFPYIPEFKPSNQQAPNTDSAKLKFFLDTKYGLADSSEFPVSVEPEMGLKPEFTSGFPSEYPFEASFSDPFLEMLNDPLLSPNSEEGDDRRGRKYKCPYCSVSCANNGQLKGHLRVHTGEKPFRCDFVDCGRAFARNEELTRHRRIHSGLRPHTCSTCSKKFGRKDHLNKHQKTHLKTAEKKVHMCNVPGCEQRYTRSDALARHQWGAHGIKSKSPKWRTQVRDNKQACV